MYFGNLKEGSSPKWGKLEEIDDNIRASKEADDGYQRGSLRERGGKP